jgi:site-specific DNA-methyltransferase (adenine-specific)
MKNKLYFGDNLNIMRDHISDESIDLIYLDPPFNSKATYNVLFAEKNGTQSRSQVTAFEDTWHWGMESEEAYHEAVTQGPKKLADLMQAMRSFLGSNDMMAYLVMMAIRLVEMHRVLKSTGSIYLHCDPTASHYLKLLLDAVFGIKNFQNEVIWHYRKWPTGKYKFQRNHDVIFFYGRSETKERTFNQLYMERAPSTLKRFGTSKIISGHKDGIRLPSQMDSSDSEGVRQDDVWDIGRVPPIKQLFPTEKPMLLLERIIEASSNENDVILDPFCGCGTAVVAAEGFNRKWIGIDITHLAITLIKHRLEDTFGPELSAYEVIGDPKDLQGAKALAEHNRYQFEWWALGKVAARPAQDKQKGADSGVDGYLYFIDDNSGKAKKIVVQIKSGHVSRSQIATLNSDRKREGAEIGAFITLQEPTKPMISEAAGMGFYEPAHFPGKKCPRLQILTIGDLLSGRELQCPRVAPEITFKKAERKRKGKEDQLELL